MIDNIKLLDFEFELIEKLSGKLTLLQPEDEKIVIVSNMVDILLANGRVDPQLNFLKDEGEKQRFVKQFLSYGVIEDLLCDSDVEDIIINSLRTIYIHHAQLGFIPTTKNFSSHREIDLFVRKLLLFAGRDGKLKKI